MRPSLFAVEPASGELRPGNFFTGIYETALSAQELLIAVEVPVAQKKSAYFFHEFARRQGDYAIAGLAAQAIVQGGLFTDLRMAYFAVGDRPILVKAAAKLINIGVTPAVLAEASGTLGEELDPQEDQQASAAMRRHLACRCTGYHAIIDAVETTARARMGRKP